MPRKDRTFTNSDLTRFACRNLGSEEQAKIVHELIDSDCFSIEFTLDQVEKIICQHMDASSRRQLIKQLITESLCNGENKTIACQTIIPRLSALEEGEGQKAAALTKKKGVLYQ